MILALVALVSLIVFGLLCEMLAVFVNAFTSARRGRDIRVGLNSYRPPPRRRS